MPSSSGLKVNKKRKRGSAVNASTSANLSDEDAWKQSRVVRCSYKVLQLIGDATLTEKVIREALGNNPDTSKALRLLVKQRLLKRVGFGGRSCPFHYQQRLSSEIRETQVKSEAICKTEEDGNDSGEAAAAAAAAAEGEEDEEEREVVVKEEEVEEEDEEEEEGYGYGEEGEYGEEEEEEEEEEEYDDDEPPELPQRRCLEMVEVKIKAEPDLEHIPVPGWRIVSD